MKTAFAVVCLAACALWAQVLPFPGPGAASGGLAFPLDFTSGALPAGVTLARASAGTYLNGSGVLVSAANNVARFTAGSTLLVEPAAVNLMQYSNGFSSGSWYSNASAVVTAAQFTSVDGTNNGWSLTAGTGYGARQNAFTASGGSYTISVWCKRITGTAPMVLTVGGSNSGNVATSSTLTRLVWTQTTSTTGASNVGLGIGAAAGSTNGIFGVQIEAGAAATSYIPNTTSGTASRSADVVTFTIPAGVGHLTYTFDDNSTQTVAVSPGVYTVPTNLNRPNLKSIASGA